MCLAIPGKIKKISGKKATVQYPNQTREVMIGDALVKIGDYVLIQMGIVVKILSSAEAKSSQKAWESL